MNKDFGFIGRISSGFRVLQFAKACYWNSMGAHLFWAAWRAFIDVGEPWGFDSMWNVWNRVEFLSCGFLTCLYFLVVGADWNRNGLYGFFSPIVGIWLGWWCLIWWSPSFFRLKPPVFLGEEFQTSPVLGLSKLGRAELPWDYGHPNSDASSTYVTPPITLGHLSSFKSPVVYCICFVGYIDRCI